ncbi:MAG: RagB/SusD family nutrient uptake outer membrane protein [Candidatus Cryptobacteroides sp.]
MRKIYIYICSAMILASCELDQIPHTSITYKSGDPIIENGIQLEAFRNGAASSFRSKTGGQFALCCDLMCDGFNATSGYGNSYGTIHCTDDSFTASDNYIANWWSGMYSAIKDFNVLIKALEKYSPASGYEKTTARTAKGEACFYRAYCYHQLVRAFAQDYEPETAKDSDGVPLVLEVKPKDQPGRASVQEVYESICTDLDTAAVCLASEGASNSLRPTKDAVKALRARVYLDMHDYSKAAELSYGLISKNTYRLSSGKQEMMEEFAYDSGTESIMRMLPEASAVSVQELGGVPSFKPYTNLGNEGSINKSVCFRPSFIPSSSLLGLYEDDDFRRALWFDNSSYPIYLNGSMVRDSGIEVFVKYMGNTKFNTGNLPAGQQAPKPLMIAEQYLICAEAGFLSGDKERAAEMINKLRGTRNASTIQSIDFQTIQDEWHRETAGDGLRMSCLKRWHKGFSSRPAQAAALDADLVLTGGSFTEKTMEASDNHWSWPIPNHDITLNRNLLQNPGYGSNTIY